MWSASVLLIASSFALAAQVAYDVDDALRALSAPTADERDRGERWLAARAQASDYPALASFATRAGAEARLRVIDALAGEDRLIDLALLLAFDSEPAARVLGQEAFQRMVQRWHDSHDAVAGEPAGGLSTFVEDGARELQLGPHDVPLEVALDRLARLGADSSPESRVSGAAMGIVLDPDLAARAPRSVIAASIRGEFAQALEATTRASGAKVLAFAVNGPRPWLLVTARERGAAPRANALWLEWCRLSTEGGERARAASRALASTGCAPLLAWLERRFVAHGDRSAFDALALAAGRGWVAPALATDASVRALLARADRASAEPDPDDALGESLRALRAIGAVAADGSDLRAPLIEGFDALAPRAQAMRCHALAAIGAPPDEFARKLVERIARPAASADELDLALHGLRCLARSREPSTATLPRDRVLALAARAIERGREEALIEIARSRRVAFPTLLDADAARASSPVLRALLFELALELGLDGEGLANELRAACGGSMPFGGDIEARWVLCLTRWRERGRGPELAQLFARAQSGADDATAFRLRALAALVRTLDRGEHEALLSALVGRGAVDGSTATLLGALAAGPVGRQARALVIGGLRDAAVASRPLEPWIDGAGRALSELRAAGAPETADAWRDELLEVARKVSLDVLADDVDEGRFPRVRSREPIDLERLQREQSFP